MLYDRVVGGAVSVKLKSWQNRVILKAAAEQDIERNMFALVKLCTTAGIQPPPPFELRYLSTVMRQYAGDSTQMFAHVRCLESKAHVYWSFDLREPFVPHEDLSAEQRNLYYFAHGSDTSGVEGVIFSHFLAPATLADGPEAVGHYSQATPWNDDASFIQTLDRVTNSAKWQCPVITQGYASIPGTHFVLKSGGGDEAQQQCLISWRGSL